MSSYRIRICRSVSFLSLGVLLTGPVSARAESITVLTTLNTLRFLDSATPGTVSSPLAITGLQAGEVLLGIDYRPASGDLYGLGSTSRLYSVNTTTGAATQVGSAGAFTLSGTAFGFDFNPTVDRIRVTSDTGQNIRLNPNNGTLAATDTALNPGTPRVVGSAYSDNFPGAATTTLYDIDSNLDALFSQLPPNSGLLNPIGFLGFDTSDLVGFDISGLSGVAYAAMTAPAGNLSQLFAINLSTGAATLIGTIGGQVAVTALAAPVGVAVPEPATTSLIVAGAVALAARRRRRLAR